MEKWKSRLSATTSKSYLKAFNLFMEWLRESDSKFKDYTPDQLIEYQRNADNGSLYDILDLAQQYISSRNIRNNTKKQYYTTIKSFFLHNRCELPRDPGFRTRSTKPPVRGTLTLDELKQVCLKANKTYRAVFLSMFQGAMDQASFVYWNMNGYSDLVKQLREGKDIIKIDLPGRKKSRNARNFYSFLGRDAVEAIRDYLKTRPKPKGENVCIFTNQYGKPITSKQSLRIYWLRKLKNLGLVDESAPPKYSSRTGKNLHELRDLFRSQWSKSPASHVVAEFCMGHQIDELGYDKSYRDTDFYLAEYRKAQDHLNIMSSEVPFGLVKQDKILELERENQELREKLEESQTSLKDEIAELRAMINKELGP